jgi:hypothetical protein
MTRVHSLFSLAAFLAACSGTDVTPVPAKSSELAATGRVPCAPSTSPPKPKPDGSTSPGGPGSPEAPTPPAAPGESTAPGGPGSPVAMSTVPCSEAPGDSTSPGGPGSSASDPSTPPSAPDDSIGSAPTQPAPSGGAGAANVPAL